MTDENELLLRVEGKVGATLRGKYHLDAVLGVGGMAAVYAATNTSVQRRCAVKMLHAELSLLTDVRERFLREGRAANTVKHPSVVDVLDTDVAEDGSAFLVMELLEGESVETLCERAGKLETSLALRLAYDLLAVLATAHGKGIVHRDIKPANLFLTTDGRLKVLDFGIARLRDVQSGAHTQAGMAMGTPAFMAPEQALGGEVGPRTDLWAVGATMFNVLTGEKVHEATSVQRLVIDAATRPARSLATVAPDIDRRVAKLVDHALAFAEDQRWESAEVMRSAVASTFEQVFGRSVTTQPLLPEHAAEPASGDDLASPSSHRLRIDAQATGGDATALHQAASEAAAPPPAPSRAEAPVAEDSALVVRGADERRAPPVRARSPWGIAAVLASALVVAAVSYVYAANRATKPEPSPGETATQAPTPVTGAPGSALEARPREPTPTVSASGAASPTAPASPLKAGGSTAPKPKASASASATATTNCNPNYTVDVDGNKRFKPECFP